VGSGALRNGTAAIATEELNDMDRSVSLNPKSYMKLPFRRAVLRGLGVVLPPLLTVVILVWILSTVQNYLLTPIESATKHAVTWMIDDTLASIPPTAEPIDSTTRLEERFRFGGQDYVAIDQGQWIPLDVYQRVRQDVGDAPLTSSHAYYHRYVELKYLKKIIIVPVLISLFVLTMYLLGRFLAYGLGRMLFNAMESIIAKLPIIRTVYTSVKQVTDFVFSENEMEFTRVVAVEYPRKGIWSLGFVTGESLRDIADAAGEAVLAVLIPTSPMPATGFVITVRRSEVVDLNISLDQAFQFVMSCGVVSPLPQQYHVIGKQIQAAIGESFSQGAPQPDQAFAE
jgi:uncharacterized membrane protein